MKITIGGFTGANKALHPKLLGDTVGVESLNQKPGRGDLRPWKTPLTVANVPAARQTIYRFGRDTKSDGNYWFSWNAVVHAVRGYNTEDTTERTYFTGDGVPKWTDNSIALAGAPFPTAIRTLGVPAPVSAVIVTSNNDGTSENNESRYYTYTYVNTKGDESAPAPVSLELGCKTDDTVAIASVAAPPGGYDINRIRHYRTQSGQTGETEFFFLRETNAAANATTDDLRALGDVLETDGWLTPPADLSYLTPMWNGMLAGITGNSVRVCAAFTPYAWPLANDFPPPDAKPVALGRWQQNVLVLTTAKPALLTGTSPDSLDLAPLDGGQACIAARAAVSFPHGVAWPCEDGLAYYGSGRAPGLITAGLLTRDDWQAMNPTGMVAGIYEGAYLCFYTDGGGVRRGFLVDPLNPQGIYFLDAGYSALFFDELQDALYVLDGTDVKKWDAGAAMMTATFRSKVFITPPVNFRAAKVTADAYPVTVKVDAGPFKADEQAKLLAARPLLTAVGATHVRYTKAVADGSPFALPDGFLAMNWQVQVETDQPVQGVVLASTIKETA
jgi:hypothetical protein